MKKIIALMLVLATVLSMNVIVLGTSAKEKAIEGVTLPDGTIMCKGYNDGTSKNGWIAVNDAAGFKDIKAGKKYYLTADIDLTKSGVNFVTFEGAGVSDGAAVYTIDGCGYTVTTNKPLFDQMPYNNNADTPVHSVIKNLVIEGTVKATATEFANESLGVIAGTTHGGIYTNIVNNASVSHTDTSAGASVGGLFGSALSADVTLTNCVNSGAINGKSFAGGMIAYAKYNVTITKCTNESTAIITGGQAGGILGKSTTGANITFCVNKAAVIGTSAFTGGIAGDLRAKSTISYCLNTGDVSNSGSRAAAGILGYGAGASTITYNGVKCNVVNTAPTNSYQNEALAACGIAGYINNASVNISNNFFIGSLSSTNGGIVASVYSPSTTEYSKVKNNYFFITEGETPVNYAYKLGIVEGGTINKYPLGNGEVQALGWTGVAIDKSAFITEEQVKNGHLAYIMQNASTAAANTWGQDLTNDADGIDLNPVLFGDKVYYDENDKAYRNGYITKQDITLGEDLNFRVYAKAPANATMVFTLNGVKTEVKGDAQGDDVYLYTFYGIAPQYIGTKITSELCIDGVTVDGGEKSIVDYCEAAYPADTTSELAKLLETVYRYGKAALGYVSAKYPTSYEGITVESTLFDSKTAGEVPAYDGALISGEANGASFYSANVFFDSTNSIVLKIKLDNGVNASDVTINGQPIGNADANNICIFRVDDIYASGYNTAYTFKLEVNDVVGQQLVYSVNIYAQRMANKDGASDEMKALAAATYEYGVTANDYYTASSKYTLGGEPLQDFVIVADSTANDNALEIANFVKTKHGINLDIVSAENYYFGNAILIDQGNTYGGVRYGIDTDISSSGDILIHIDGLSTYTSDMTDKFLKNYLTTASNKNFALPEDEFYYDYTQYTDTGKAVYSNGYSLNTATDEVTRTLADGVTYIERTYTTAAVKSGSQTVSPIGVKNTMYILIIKADAAAHLEVYNAPYKDVTCTKTFYCNHENKYIAECGNEHVNKKTAATLAAEMEAAGKNVLAAFNASFFMKASGCNVPWGMQIVNGHIYREPREVHNYSDDNNIFVDTYTSARGDYWFGITKDGKPVISNIKGYNETYKGNILNGVGGTYTFMENGKYRWRGTSETSGDAIVFIGYNSNGDIVIVANDGDNYNHAQYPGVTRVDMSQILMDLDMDITAAIQMDGGGSTAALIEDENGVLQRENKINSSKTNNTVSYLEDRLLPDIIAIVAD